MLATFCDYYGDFTEGEGKCPICGRYRYGYESVKVDHVKDDVNEEGCRPVRSNIR